MIRKIGSGAFGEIYLAVNKENSHEYAVKTEKSNTGNPLISFEANIYNYLNTDSSAIVPDKGIP